MERSKRTEATFSSVQFSAHLVAELSGQPAPPGIAPGRQLLAPVLHLRADADHMSPESLVPLRGESDEAAQDDYELRLEAHLLLEAVREEEAAEADRLLHFFGGPLQLALFQALQHGPQLLAADAEQVGIPDAEVGDEWAVADAEYAAGLAEQARKG